jgi:hypothetical protein
VVSSTTDASNTFASVEVIGNGSLRPFVILQLNVVEDKESQSVDFADSVSQIAIAAQGRQHCKQFSLAFVVYVVQISVTFHEAGVGRWPDPAFFRGILRDRMLECMKYSYCMVLFLLFPPLTIQIVMGLAGYRKFTSLIEHPKDLLGFQIFHLAIPFHGEITHPEDIQNSKIEVRLGTVRSCKYCPVRCCTVQYCIVPNYIITHAHTHTHTTIGNI